MTEEFNEIFSLRDYSYLKNNLIKSEEARIKKEENIKLYEQYFQMFYEHFLRNPNDATAHISVEKHAHQRALELLESKDKRYRDVVDNI